MPQIAVEYSGNLGAAFDAESLADRIHGIVAATIDTPLGNCKTRLIELQRYVIGDGGAREAMVHVDLRILSGRGEAEKKRLGEAVLAAAAEAIGEPEGLRVQLTVEVRELDRENYHKRLIRG
ncbi:MAG TPA: hypothetical protein VF552_15100 [Allosphingosinicella sp.]